MHGYHLETGCLPTEVATFGKMLSMIRAASQVPRCLQLHDELHMGTFLFEQRPWPVKTIFWESYNCSNCDNGDFLLIVHFSTPAVPRHRLYLTLPSEEGGEQMQCAEYNELHFFWVSYTSWTGLSVVKTSSALQHHNGSIQFVVTSVHSPHVEPTGSATGIPWQFMAVW